MCGAYIVKVRRGELERRFGLPDQNPLNFEWDRLLRPTDAAPIVRRGESGDLELILARWGFVPANAESLAEVRKLSLFNARDDKLEPSKIWREAFRTRRCIVPASSFIEFGGPKGSRLPVPIGLASGQVFGMAGLWSRWVRGDQIVESFAVVTTAPNAVVAPLHHRMPVIVKPNDWAAWLAPNSEVADLQVMLRPYPSSHMVV
jgi:putative SOS response-associated peptidase YedK